jgi:hypothetical protein
MEGNTNWPRGERATARPLDPRRNVTHEVPRGTAWSKNEIVGGLELRLSRELPRAALEQLEQAGWRWSSSSGAWFHRDTPENLAFAQQFCQRF